LTNRSLLQRPGAVGDLLGAFDHRVDRPVVTLAPFEGVLVDDPPGPGTLPATHDPARFEDLPGEVVPVPVEVIRDPTMKPNPASSKALRLPADSIPASATTTRSVTP